MFPEDDRIIETGRSVLSVLLLNIRLLKNICVCVYIQGVPGGMRQTSGECSLG